MRTARPMFTLLPALFLLAACGEQKAAVEEKFNSEFIHSFSQACVKAYRTAPAFRPSKNGKCANAQPIKHSKRSAQPILPAPSPATLMKPHKAKPMPPPSPASKH